MMKTYEFDDMAQSDKHPVIRQAEAVEAALAKAGFEVDLIGHITPNEGSEAAEKGLYITPDYSEAVEKQLEILGWLTIKRAVSETFEADEDIKGSQEITNIVVREDLTAADVIAELADTDYSEDDDTSMLQKVIHALEVVQQPKDPQNLAVVMGYDILRKSLGWEAERRLASTDDFHKALASLDPKGIDLGTNADSPWDDKGQEGFQLKTMQRITSKSLHLGSSGYPHRIPHLSYAWTENGINVATLDERRSSDKQAAHMGELTGEDDIGTLMKKSEESSIMENYGRPARVIAWD